MCATSLRYHVTYILGYFAALLTFLILDMVWMFGIARAFYRDQLHHLIRDDIKILPAVLFYVVYIGVLIYLAVMPHVYAGGIGLQNTIISSALLGLAAYGTYHFTNYALLHDWPLSITIVDLLWGMVVSTSAAIAGYVTIVTLV
jgi:uncharacterized membrane protein